MTAKTVPAALAVCFVLSGCPVLGDVLGSKTPNPKILAVTESSTPDTSKVYLKWQTTSGGRIYEVYKVIGGQENRLSAQTKLEYTDSVAADTEVTYFVRALDESGKPIGDSPRLTTRTLKATLSKPTGLKADDNDAAPLATVSSLSPKLAWTTVDNATGYYVALKEQLGDLDIGALHLGTLTTATSFRVGLSVEDPNLPMFEVKYQPLRNQQTFTYSVTAFRADTTVLKDIKSIAVSAQETGKLQISL